MSSDANNVDITITVSGESPDPTPTTEGLNLGFDSELQSGTYEDSGSAVWVVTSTSVSISDDPDAASDPVNRLNGAQIDPVTDTSNGFTDTQAYDGRITDDFVYSSDVLVSFPATLNTNQVLVKAKSRTDSNTDDRRGLLSETKAIYAVPEAPPANAFAPAAIGWTGRTALAPNVVDLDATVSAFKDTLPVGGFDVTSLPDQPTYAALMADIEKFMPLHAQRLSTNVKLGGYEVLGIPYRNTRINYARNTNAEFSRAYLYACSNLASDAEIKEILRKLISIGIQWLDPHVNEGSVVGGNGANRQNVFIPALIAQWARGYPVTDLADHFPGNQLAQTFQITQSMIDNDFKPHDSDFLPYHWRRRTVDSTPDGNTVRVPRLRNGYDGDPKQSRFSGMVLRREVGDVNAGVIVASSANAPSGFIDFTYTGTANLFSAGDVIYLESPYPLVAGTFDWLITAADRVYPPDGFSTYSPLPNANYRSLNKFATSAMAAILQGGSHVVFENLIGYVDRCMQSNEPAGYDFPHPADDTLGGFDVAFMDAHWATISA